MWKKYLLDDESDYDSDENIVTKVLMSPNNMLHYPKWSHSRVQWNAHVDKLLHEKSFARTYRMTHPSFQKLVSLVAPVACRYIHNSRCNEKVTAELIVAIVIRWLAGGSYLDLKNVYGLSSSYIYICRDKFIDAIVSLQDMKIVLPSSQNEWHVVRCSFMKKSSHQIFRVCVGAIDGFFLPTQCPSKKECYGDQISYYSGHYNSYGLNIQAVCDSKLQFIYFGVVGKGSTNDAYAYISTGLPEILKNFPAGKIYFVGDAAYPLSEQLLTPFTGSHRDDANKDSFNYFLSQMRIRIEMEFGYLTSKWPILRTKMQGSLKNISKDVVACACLQNFIIKNDVPTNMEVEEYFEKHGTSLQPLEGTKTGLGFLPSTPEDMVLSQVPGLSLTRNTILNHIASNAYRRPAHNIICNKI